MADIEIATLVDRFMRSIHTGLQQQASQFDQHQVGPSGGMLLMTLSDIEPAPIQELVKKMTRDKSQMTRLIKSLETKGLVSRSQLDTDARVCMISLTPKGHKTVKTLQKALASVIGGLSPLDDCSRNKLSHLLTQALGNNSDDRD